MFYPHHGINTPKWGQSASRHRWLLVLCASIFLVFCYASIDGLTGSTVYAGMERADALPTICEAGQDGEIKFCPQIGILPDSVATSIAWGDYDDDGDLDLAVGHGIPYSDPDLVKRDGNRGIYRDKIYRNHEGEFKLHLTLPITDSTRDIAWVDFDNDNDLDLVTANDDYIRIYENQSEIINKKPITISSPITGEPLDAQSMDWADYDGDGDLDLAVGNGIIVLNYQTQAPMSFRGKPDYIYKNLWDEEARFESVPIPGGSLPTTSIAWGDYTGDQKPDLVIGNGGIGRTKLYSNTANSNNDEILNFHQDIPGLFSTQSIAWGDYDNDGDLDLALGNLDLDRIVSPSLENLIKNNMGMTETVDGKNYIFENLLNESGKVGFKALPWSPYNAATTSVAWADYNGDGYLDLAVGNFTLLNTGDLEAVNSLYLYKDEEQPFSSKPDWETEVYDNDATMHIAWADYDNDSDLDLTTVNIDLDIGQPIKIYRNDHTSLSSQGQIIAENEEWSLQAVWGDYDGDGDLDVAVANRNQMPESLADGFSPNASVRVYQNMLIPSGTLTFTRQAIPDLTLTITDSVVSVAWGDYDVDGDLDLVIGSGDMVTVSIDGKIYPDFTGGENRVFQNLLKDPEQSGFKEVWNSSEGLTDISDVCSHAQTLCTQTDATTSVVWGDYDGDGDLDLAVANGILAARPNQIYRNDGVINGRLSLTHVWSSDETPSMAMAWGDYDQDGDLDLAVANRLHPNQIYQNQGQTEDGFPLFELVWESDEKDDSLSVKWGDVTGDGYLDLVFGNRKNNRIYYNQSKIPADEFSEEATTGEKSDCERLNQTLFACTAQWTSIDSEVTMDVALGDYDDDGDLDLVAANGGLDPVTALHTANHLYRNDDGVLSRLATWVFGQSRDSGSEDSQSSASVDWGDVDLDGTLDLLVSTLDGPNVIYTNIRQTETISPSLPIIRVGNPGKIAANGYASAKILSDSPIAIPFTLTHPMSMTVRKIQAWYSLDGGGHWQPAEPITLTQTTDLETSPTGIGYTFEWDVHKSGVMGQSDNVVVRIDALPAIKPRENDVLGDYLYGSSSDTTLPFRVRGTQVRVVDVNAGPLSKALVYGISNQTNFNEEPLGGLVNPFKTSQLGYLQGRETLSDTALLFALAPITVTQKYTLYYTGKLTIEADADITPITQSGIMTVPVSSENPLYIFDLTVSLEWDARKDRLYLQQLSSDLRRTSEILYDATNGQAALGNITIYHAKNYWHDADIRIYTTNRLRPHAAIGGITDGIKIKPFTISATETITTAYTGGQVHMPVEWNRYGDVTGSQNEDWPRTLAHELGHYLFYLLDSYFYLDDEGLPIAVQNCDGLMSNPYIEEFTEFHPSGSWDEQCVNTYAYQELRLSEWAVMKLFYEGLQPPPPDTTYEKLETGPNTLPIAVTNVHFAELQGQPSTTLESPKFYLVEHDLTESDNEKRYIASLSARVYLFQDGSILDLGRPRQDEIRAWGAKIDNDDRICVYDPPATGCLDVGNGGISRITMKPQKDWSPDILISPSAPNTLTIGVKQVDQGITLAAQIY
ncbi:MAG: VCBS repeat-containing protein, partial [Chloroflexota bacterium]